MMKKRIIMIAVFFTVILLSVYAQGKEIIVQGTNLAEKLNWLNVFVQSNNVYILEVNVDERIPPYSFDYSGKNNITITIRGIGANRFIRSNGGTLFTVGSSNTLVLDNNIIIHGGVNLGTGGNLIMNKGVVISTGGVNVDGGTFTMNDGEISGNTVGVSVGSGGIVSHSGVFIMNGGTISGNTSSGVTMQYGGGTFTMNDGIISGNAFGGVALAAGTFTMNGGSIVSNTITANSADFRVGGGGVRVINTNTSFIMNGGKISNNRATGYLGGGVYVHNGGTFTMKNGEISGNSTTGIGSGRNRGGGSGGGVSLYAGGNFTMSGGTISGNTASDNGGGVHVHGTFTMSSGTISSNTARDNGGGVYISNESIFTKTGGTITGYINDAENGNVVKNTSDAIQNFRGHAVYAGSTDTVLKIKGNTAEHSDDLSYGERIGRFGYSPTVKGDWDN